MRETSDGAEQPKKILNAMMVLKSGDSKLEAETPPIMVAEFITTDLSADHLATCLERLRKDEYTIFNSNVIPYLIQTDCARGILRATVQVYNKETVREYLWRMLVSARRNEEPDPTKITVAWCFGHCIRLVNKISLKRQQSYTDNK